MKTIKQNTTKSSKNANRVKYKWRIIALSIPVLIAALVLIGISLIKDKVKMTHHVNSSYSAGDVALFVAMPMLHAVMK
jgi:hypothetical protein